MPPPPPAESRTLEVRCGVKKQGDTKKIYTHMLNGTLCATERALCCLVENYQTPEVRPLFLPLLFSQIEYSPPFFFRQGLVIPEVLRPYMQGRDFIPYVREVPQKRK